MTTTMRLLSGGFAALILIAMMPASAQSEPRIAEYATRGTLAVCNEFVGAAHRPAPPSVGACGFFVDGGTVRVQIQDWVSPAVAFDWTTLTIEGNVCNAGHSIDDATFVASKTCNFLFVTLQSGASVGRVVVT